MDPIVLGHAVYRPLLQAMSRPGTVLALPPAARQQPLLALLGALLDGEVTFHLAGEGPLGREIAWRTGCRLAAAERADFLVCPGGTSGGRVARAPRGSLEYPDGGATAIYAVRRCEAAGGRVVLRGPGIRDAAAPLIEGLDGGELELLRDANREFPLGVDAVFLDEEARVLCIPRSTRIEVR